MLVASDASAQVCDGRAPFNYLPLQLAGALSGGTGGTAASAAAGFGKDLLFGTVATAFDGDHTAIDVVAGSDQPVTPDNRLRACPLASIGVGFHNEETSLRLAAGGRASYLAVNSPRVWVIPTIGLQYRSEASVTFFEIEGGVGLVRRPFALRPSVIQRAGDISATRVQVVLSVGF
jgi:hypothetical protein